MFMNPYAQMVRGYQVYKASNLNPQMELRQDLKSLVPGLSASVMTYLQRYSYHSIARAYSPFFYTSTVDAVDPSQYTLSVLNNGAQGSAYQPTGTEYLGYDEQPRDKVITSKMYLQGSLDYAGSFQKHEVSGLLTGFISSFESGNSGSVVASLPQRNTVLAGRATYGYNNRYLAEFNFGYNGSERFAKKNRHGFFPSIGLAYNISNEVFFEPLKKAVTELKVRFSYGLVGNDQIGNVNDRFFYLSDVQANDSYYGASFGTGVGTGLYTLPGYAVNRYGNDNIAWEISKQTNLGLDFTLWDSFSVVANAFTTQRSNIFFENPNIESAQGLNRPPSANYGTGSTRGIDLSMTYTKSLASDIALTLAGTFTYATSKIKKNDQIQYSAELAHLSKTGYSFRQEWGLIAERLFIDDEEVANSPSQTDLGRGTVRAGDIKYRDISGDGKINGDDAVPIGYPTQPEIVYGIGPSMMIKRLDFGFMFQGAARSSFFIDPLKTQPFIQFGGFNPDNGDLLPGTGYQNGELQAIHDDHWSEENPNPYAFWPRLNDQVEANNLPRSTWWMRSGSFIRLKTVTLGYSFSPIRKMYDVRPRLYLSANNLFAISDFKLWDVEMGGNGLGYPIQRVVMIGLQLDF
jgi:TonB-linked SusC/RagA family outer membrane protein